MFQKIVYMFKCVLNCFEIRKGNTSPEIRKGITSPEIRKGITSPESRRGLYPRERPGKTGPGATATDKFAGLSSNGHECPKVVLIRRSPGLRRKLRCADPGNL